MPMLGGEKLAELLRHPAFIKGPAGAKAKIILAGKGAGSGLVGKFGISHCDGGFVGAKALTFGGTLLKGLGLGTVGIGLAVVDWMRCSSWRLERQRYSGISNSGRLPAARQGRPMFHSEAWQAYRGQFPATGDGRQSLAAANQVGPGMVGTVCGS